MVAGLAVDAGEKARVRVGVGHEQRLAFFEHPAGDAAPAGDGDFRRALGHAGAAAGGGELEIAAGVCEEKRCGLDFHDAPRHGEDRGQQFARICDPVDEGADFHEAFIDLELALEHCEGGGHDRAQSCVRKRAEESLKCGA